MNLRLCVRLALFPILLCGATVLAQAPPDDPAELAKWRKTVEAGIVATEANLAVAEQGLIVINSLEGYRTVGGRRYYVFPSAAAKQRRIDAIKATLASERAKLARDLESDVFKGLKRADFLRQVPEAKLDTHERPTGFRAYKIGHPLIKVRRWYFLDDELLGITHYVCAGRRLPNDKTNEMMRKLGPPHSDEIAPADLRDGQILHSKWLFKDENSDLSIHYKVFDDRELGYIYLVEVFNCKIMDMHEAKKQMK